MHGVPPPSSCDWTLQSLRASGVRDTPPVDTSLPGVAEPCQPVSVLLTLIDPLGCDVGRAQLRAWISYVSPGFVNVIGGLRPLIDETDLGPLGRRWSYETPYSQMSSYPSRVRVLPELALSLCHVYQCCLHQGDGGWDRTIVAAVVGISEVRMVSPAQVLV